MTKPYNIFIEGIPGSGKSTLLDTLSRHFTDYRVYREGDISPVELAWCAYMSEDAYRQSLLDLADMRGEVERNTIKEGVQYIVPYTKIKTGNYNFYEYMEKFEIYGGRKDPSEFREIILRRFQDFHLNGNVFECSFFQNIIEELMLYAMFSDQQIIDFYVDLAALLDLSAFKLIRLVSPDIRQCIQTIKKERVNPEGEEVWYLMMIDYLSRSPYGAAHQIQDFEGMVSHFKRRIALESEVMKLLPAGCCFDIESKHYDTADLLRIFNASPDDLGKEKGGK